MGSGKTTAAEALRHHLQVTMSQPIEVFKTIYAQTIYDIHDYALDILKDKGIIEKDVQKDGNLLQLLGTKWGRESIDDLIWVKCTQDTVAKAITDYEREKETAVVIVSDCRFKNEYHAFPNALQVRLECDRERRKARCHSWRDKENHISETDLDEYVQQNKFDLVLHTDHLDPVGVATLIAAQLEKGNWVERRTRRQLVE
jgi:hypothetical protein